MPRPLSAVITPPLYLTIWQAAHSPRRNRSTATPTIIHATPAKAYKQHTHKEDFMTQRTRTGALIFDETADRYDIRFDLADYYGGLHCGDCFDVFVRGKWKPTRIEMNPSQEWYLVGVRAHDLNGLRVRI